MKVRNILIGLLVVLMAFVFISCEDEPEEQVQPVQVDDSVYKLVATKGIKDDVFNHDKFSIWFNEKVVAGQTISMEFRSTTDFFQMNVRGIEGMPKYVYEEDIKDDGSNTFTLEPLSDGWTKFTYTFDDDAEANDDFRVDFRGWVAVGDIMEIRHVFYGGKQIALSEDNMSGESYAAPTFETVDDHAWAEPETYVVAYFVGKPSSVDKYPVVEMVKAGEKVTKTGLSKDNYTINHIYNYDKSGKQGAEFDENTAINADTFLLVEWKGVDVDITFHKNFPEEEDETVVSTTEFGQPITKPDWQVAGWRISGWTTAAEPTEDNVFDLSTPVASTDAIEIYAQWSNVAILTLNWNYGDEPATTEVPVTPGNAPDAAKAKLGRPGYTLSGWTVGPAANSGAYAYDSALNEDKTIYAQWTEATTVYKFTANLGTDGKDDKKYSQDKFVLTWSPNLQVNPGDVLSIAFKAERADEMTAGRSYTYSIRDAKKWFSEKSKGTAYPQFWSTYDDSAEDGWIYATYVFPESSAATKETITYPATFQVHFRDEKIAVAGATYNNGTPDDDTDDYTATVSDILYVKGFAVNGQPLTLNEETSAGLFAAPTITTL